MRLLASAVLGLVFCSGAAMAQDKSNGCGVGWYIFKDKSIVASSVRGTTNSVSPNSFSMTSGTSGCAQHSLVLEESRGLHYLEANFDHVRMEAARGDGTMLSGLAASLGCRGEDYAAFKNLNQTHYTYLYQGAQVGDASDVLARVKYVMSQDLPSACKS